jgi:hypothetical protein
VGVAVGDGDGVTAGVVAAVGTEVAPGVAAGVSVGRGVAVTLGGCEVAVFVATGSTAPAVPVAEAPGVELPAGVAVEPPPDDVVAVATGVPGAPVSTAFEVGVEVASAALVAVATAPPAAPSLPPVTATAIAETAMTTASTAAAAMAIGRHAFDGGRPSTVGSVGAGDVRDGGGAVGRSAGVDVEGGVGSIRSGASKGGADTALPGLAGLPKRPGAPRGVAFAPGSCARSALGSEVSSS